MKKKCFFFEFIVWLNFLKLKIKLNLILKKKETQKDFIITHTLTKQT